jgi:biopolymer transport protein ExbB/TolQ
MGRIKLSDKTKFIITAVISVILVLSIGLNIYSVVGLAETSKQLSSARAENQRLTDSNSRAIKRATDLQAILDRERGIIAELETRLSEQELLIVQLGTRLTRISDNFRKSEPIFTETRKIFEKYNSP